MNFGERLKKIRIENGLTQIQLAKILDISKSNISKYEAGSVEPNLEITAKIATYFTVSTDYLLGLSESKIADTDLEWRYPPVKNRLGTILSKYRSSKQFSISEFAKSIDISDDLEIKLENGVYEPSMPLLKKISNVTGYDIDYLVGARDKAYLSSSTHGINTLEGDFHFRARFEELCLRYGISKDNSEQFLGISPEDFFDISWNRMPTLPELLRIAYAFNVSVDYLIGKSDTPFSDLAKDELELILNYRDCIEPYKENIRERAEKLSSDSVKYSSVAADEKIKEAK